MDSRVRSATAQIDLIGVVGGAKFSAPIAQGYRTVVSGDATLAGPTFPGPCIFWTMHLMSQPGLVSFPLK
jgi:hypothetical protein